MCCLAALDISVEPEPGDFAVARTIVAVPFFSILTKMDTSTALAELGMPWNRLFFSLFASLLRSPPITILLKTPDDARSVIEQEGNTSGASLNVAKAARQVLRVTASAIEVFLDFFALVLFMIGEAMIVRF